jgi:hypothetical protein
LPLRPYLVLSLGALVESGQAAGHGLPHGSGRLLSGLLPNPLLLVPLLVGSLLVVPLLMVPLLVVPELGGGPAGPDGLTVVST